MERQTAYLYQVAAAHRCHIGQALTGRWLGTKAEVLRAGHAKPASIRRGINFAFQADKHRCMLNFINIGTTGILRKKTARKIGRQSFGCQTLPVTHAVFRIRHSAQSCLSGQSVVGNHYHRTIASEHTQLFFQSSIDH